MSGSKELGATAQSRLVQVPVTLVQQTVDALQAALRLAVSHDGVQSALQALDKPKPSALSKQLRDALQGLAQSDVGSGAPVERVDQHVFALSNLTAEFVRELLLQRGWVAGSLIVGSAQGEALARRLLFQNAAIASQVRLLPLSGGHTTFSADGWMLVERVDDGVS